MAGVFSKASRKTRMCPSDVLMVYGPARVAPKEAAFAGPASAKMFKYLVYDKAIPSASTTPGAVANVERDTSYLVRVHAEQLNPGCLDGIPAPEPSPLELDAYRAKILEDHPGLDPVYFPVNEQLAVCMFFAGPTGLAAARGMALKADPHDPTRCVPFPVFGDDAAPAPAAAAAAAASSAGGRAPTSSPRTVSSLSEALAALKANPYLALLGWGFAHLPAGTTWPVESVVQSSIRPKTMPMLLACAIESRNSRVVVFAVQLMCRAEVAVTMGLGESVGRLREYVDEPSCRFHRAVLYASGAMACNGGDPSVGVKTMKNLPKFGSAPDWECHKNAKVDLEAGAKMVREAVRDMEWCDLSDSDTQLLERVTAWLLFLRSFGVLVGGSLDRGLSMEMADTLTAVERAPLAVLIALRFGRVGLHIIVRLCGVKALWAPLDSPMLMEEVKGEGRREPAAAVGPPRFRCVGLKTTAVRAADDAAKAEGKAAVAAAATAAAGKIHAEAVAAAAVANNNAIAANTTMAAADARATADETASTNATTDAKAASDAAAAAATAATDAAKAVTDAVAAVASAAADTKAAAETAKTEADAAAATANAAKEAADTEAAAKEAAKTAAAATAQASKTAAEAAKAAAKAAEAAAARAKAAATKEKTAHEAAKAKSTAARKAATQAEAARDGLRGLHVRALHTGAISIYSLAATGVYAPDDPPVMRLFGTQQQTHGADDDDDDDDDSEQAADPVPTATARDSDSDSDSDAGRRKTINRDGAAAAADHSKRGGSDESPLPGAAAAALGRARYDRLPLLDACGVSPATVAARMGHYEAAKKHWEDIPLGERHRFHGGMLTCDCKPVRTQTLLDGDVKDIEMAQMARAVLDWGESVDPDNADGPTLLHAVTARCAGAESTSVSDEELSRRVDVALAVAKAGRSELVSIPNSTSGLSPMHVALTCRVALARERLLSGFVELGGRLGRTSEMQAMVTRSLPGFTGPVPAGMREVLYRDPGSERTQLHSFTEAGDRELVALEARGVPGAAMLRDRQGDLAIGLWDQGANGPPPTEVDPVLGTLALLEGSFHGSDKTKEACTGAIENISEPTQLDDILIAACSMVMETSPQRLGPIARAKLPRQWAAAERHWQARCELDLGAPASDLHHEGSCIQSMSMSARLQTLAIRERCGLGGFRESGVIVRIGSARDASLLTQPRAQALVTAVSDADDHCAGMPGLSGVRCWLPEPIHARREADRTGTPGAVAAAAAASAAAGGAAAADAELPLGVRWEATRRSWLLTEQGDHWAGVDKINCACASLANQQKHGKDVDADLWELAGAGAAAV